MASNSGDTFQYTAEAYRQSSIYNDLSIYPHVKKVRLYDKGSNAVYSPHNQVFMVKI